MSLWLIVEWDKGVGISYEPSSKLTLLEENDEWCPEARVKQTHNNKLFIGKVLSSWKTKAEAVKSYDELVKPPENLPGKRKIKLTEKAGDTVKLLRTSDDGIAEQTAEVTSVPNCKTSEQGGSDDDFNPERETSTYLEGLKRKSKKRTEKTQSSGKRKKLMMPKKTKAKPNMFASCESDEGDGECRSPEFNILDEISSDEDDSDQKPTSKSVKTYGSKTVTLPQANKKRNITKTKKMDDSRKLAEVQNLKNLLSRTPPNSVANPPIVTRPPLRTSQTPGTTVSPCPGPSSSPSLTPLPPAPLLTRSPQTKNMYYTECDGCRKLERKIDKMEEELQRMKKALQKLNNLASRDPKLAPFKQRTITIAPTKEEEDADLTFHDAVEHLPTEPRAAITASSAGGEEESNFITAPTTSNTETQPDIPGEQKFTIPADVLLRAEVKSSRSAGVAERALLTMLFSVDTLKVSSVMGRKIKKDEPPRAPLDKCLLNKLIGLVKERWPERSEAQIINSLNTRLKEIRHSSEV